MADFAVNERIEEKDINQEMEASFLEYAYSVIYARALPDARDGLKPVQRRILFQMSQMNLYPDRPYVKSARVVGDVMGKLHPHGDSAIYDAMVRLAQDFNQKIPLVDGHGNFGSPDDGPAAARYTEARMTPAALLMNQDLDEDTVDFVPNYDNKLMQPDVLPAAIPNLLVNGGMGIAVGMATNLAPHNLKEVARAAVYLIRHPDCGLEDLMKFVPGPDFPTGGRIVGLEAIREAYETGQGKLTLRAKTAIEKVTSKKMGIVVTELPFGVGQEKIKEAIQKAIKDHKIEGIAAYNDYTDRKNGTRLVVEVKNGFNPEAVLSRLWKLTDLQVTFGVNSVALVNGAPKTLGLKEMLEVWVGHRREVIRRRSEFRLRAKQDRLHLVEGLLLAIVDIDEVIQVIRTSDDSQEASTKLQKVFDLDEIQAQYILDLRLRRLTKFSKIELENEKAELEAQIAELQEILASKEMLDDIVCNEITEVAKVYGEDRKTQLVDNSGIVQSSAALGTGTTNALTGAFDFSSIRTEKPKVAEIASLEIPDEPCFVVMSATGMVWRTSTAPTPTDPRSQHDAVKTVLGTTTRSNIGVVTTHGRCLLTSVLEITEQPVALMHLHSNYNPAELPLGIIPLLSDGDDLKKAPPVALGTALGVVKRVKPEPAPTDRSGNIHSSWEIISLQPGDSVVGVDLAPDDAELVFISTDSSLLHFPAEKVRPQGLSAGGMAGINLAEGQSVIFFGAITPAEIAEKGGVAEAQGGGPLVLTIAGDALALPGTENGSGKLTPFNLYPGKGRATGGVRSQKFLKGQNSLIFAWAGNPFARANTATGAPVEFPEVDVRRDGSGAKLDHAIAAVG